MAAIDVSIQLVNEVPLVGNALEAKIPKMMMGIADGEFRLQGEFLG